MRERKLAQAAPSPTGPPPLTDPPFPHLRPVGGPPPRRPHLARVEAGGAALQKARLAAAALYRQPGARGLLARRGRQVGGGAAAADAPLGPGAVGAGRVGGARGRGGGGGVQRLDVELAAQVALRVQLQVSLRGRDEREPALLAAPAAAGHTRRAGNGSRRVREGASPNGTQFTNFIRTPISQPPQKDEPRKSPAALSSHSLVLARGDLPRGEVQNPIGRVGAKGRGEAEAVKPVRRLAACGAVRCTGRQAGRQAGAVRRG